MLRKLLELLLEFLLAFLHRATHIVVLEDGHPIPGGSMGSDLLNTDKRSLLLVPKDDAGVPRDVQPGSVQATSDNPSVTVTLDPSNQLSALATPADGFVSNGPVTLTFTALNLAGQQIAASPYQFNVIAAAAPQATHIDVQEAGDAPK